MVCTVLNWTELEYQKLTNASERARKNKEEIIKEIVLSKIDGYSRKYKKK